MTRQFCCEKWGKNGHIFGKNPTLCTLVENLEKCLIFTNFSGNQSLSPDSNSPSPPTVNPNPDQVGEPDKDAGSTSNNDSRRPWKKRYHEVPSPPQDQPENLEKKRVRVMTKAEKREYQNVEHFGTMDSSSTGPKSSSSGGSPPDHEDLGSDYSVSPNSEKVDQVNSTEN